MCVCVCQSISGMYSIPVISFFFFFLLLTLLQATLFSPLSRPCSLCLPRPPAIATLSSLSYSALVNPFPFHTPVFHWLLCHSHTNTTLSSIVWTYSVPWLPVIKGLQLRSRSKLFFYSMSFAFACNSLGPASQILQKSLLGYRPKFYWLYESIWGAFTS